MKASLKVEPVKLLPHLPTTSAKYEVALRLLKQRYAKKRMIIFTHMDAILEFRPLQQESAEQLRKILSVYLEKTMGLDSMGMETSDSIWVYTIAKKLDPETRRYWELYSPGDELQTMERTKTFLEERTRALEAAGQSNKQLQKSKTRNENAQDVLVYHSSGKSNIPESCPKCSEKYRTYQPM